jgi:hypothetical protein
LGHNAVVRIVPIRHHSPAAAAHVRRLIEEHRPLVVFVEGPADATALIPLLLDPGTAPPVALYAYRTGEEVRAVYYPFCSYSPEYVALREGQRIGARLAFCDVPAAVTLASPQYELPLLGTDDDATPATDGKAPAPPDAPRYDDFAAALYQAAGFDSFEQFWESAFEQDAGALPSDAFIERMADFGGKARALDGSRPGDRDLLREQHMAASVRAAVAGGIPEERVLLVCGAAHADNVAALYRDGASMPELPEAVTAELALIPYSFPRLSERSGYGAGNRAPWYYEQVWRAGGDYHAATRRTFATLAGHLRNRGEVASLAQCIDAYGLAVTLAGMRGKLAPGVDETGDAATACFGQGHAAPVAEALHTVLVGDAIGRLTARVGRTPLQSEFYGATTRLDLPVLDMPRQILLHMTNVVEAERSIFLHRLTVAEIPFAREIQAGLGGRGRASTSGPLEQLARTLEKWELQWSPATDGQLIERSAWGSTLEQVCDRRLQNQMATVTRVDAGVLVLLRAVLCDLQSAIPNAMQRCETLAADSAGFPALARAAYHVDSLLTFGAARKLPAERLAALGTRLFARAVAHLTSAVQCGDEDAVEVQETLTSLSELARRRTPVAGADLFWETVEQVSGQKNTHAGLRGLAFVLLELGGRLAPGELARRLRYWLSVSAEADDHARLVAGVFSLHRGTLIRNRSVIGAVTEFMAGLEIEQLVPLLPVLRRSLGNLSNAERAYLAETLDGLLGLRPAESTAVLRLSATDELQLREANQRVTAILEDWKGRYGIE